MKYYITILGLLLLLNVSCSQKVHNANVSKEIDVSQHNIVFQLDFEKNKIGQYTEAHLLKDVDSVVWNIVEDKAMIEEDEKHGKVLRVKYPKGGIGPKNTGIQFDRRIPKSKEYYLDYYLKFKEGFDFRLGGKLPGLSSGGRTFTGGRHPKNGEGWSARYMWRDKGAMIIYFYHMDNKHEWGDIVEMDTIFKTGKWYRITQHLKMNDGDKFNGIMEAWVDGKKVTNETNVRYRLEPLGNIDSFYFSTFHGGNTEDWAPKNDSYIYFDDFKVTNTKPKGLE
jgi:hypothetical protein